MKKVALTFCFILLFVSLTQAQVTIIEDTVYHHLELGSRTTSTTWIRNSGTSPINVQYRIFFDDVKSQSDWTVEFCDCIGCRTNYPVFAKCDQDQVTGEEPFIFYLYITSTSVIEERYLKLILMNQADTNDRDTVIFKTTQFPQSVEQNLLSEQSIRVSPNPASDKTTLEFHANSSLKISIDVVDLLGKTMVHFEQFASPGPGKQELITEDWDPGIYIIRLQTGEEIHTQKLQVY